MIGPDFGATAASVNTHYGTTKAKTAAIEYGLDLSPVFVEAVAESFPKVAPQPVPSAKPADGVATGYGQGGVDGESLAAPPPDSKPWIVTPLVESKALSKAVGWYVEQSTHLSECYCGFPLRTPDSKYP